MRRQARSLPFACLAALVLASASAPAAGEDVATDAQAELGAIDSERLWFHDRVSVRAGVVFSFVDSDLDIPPEFDLESDLDLDDFSAEPSVELLWRFTRNRRHRLEMTYFSIMRSGNSEIPVTIPLPGQTIQFGIPVRSKLDLHVIGLAYGYSLLHDERKELGLFAGIDFIWIDGEIKATVPLGELTFDVIDEDFGTPFPVLGIFFNWGLSERFSFWSRFSAFGLEVGDVSGALLKGDLRIEHDTWRYANLYFGYELLGITASIDGSLDDINQFSHGPTMGIVFRF